MKNNFTYMKLLQIIGLSCCACHVLLLFLFKNATPRFWLFGSTKDKGYDDSCSCWTQQPANNSCCSRVLVGGHKFGTILQMDLFHDFRQRANDSKQQGIYLQNFPRAAVKGLPTDTDFRHVAVTRNIVDAIVSGYLYHKAGHECWITPRGLKNTSAHGELSCKTLHCVSSRWYSKLRFHKTYGIPFPDAKNRSLCTYLNEESEQDGMRVLIDFALSQWYRGVASYWSMVQNRFQQEGINRVLFICYEDLTDPHQQEAMFLQSTGMVLSRSRHEQCVHACTYEKVTL